MILPGGRLIAPGLLGLVALAASSASPESGRSAPPGTRPRVLVLTDISSLTAGEAEPDDGQSLLRLLLYTNDLDLEGLIATSNLRHGRVVRPELIHQAIDAYGVVRPRLAEHDPRYPTAARLHSLVRAGQPVADREVPVAESIGPSRNSAGSRWIEQCVDRPDPRPLWITIWGGSADLAQALLHVRATRSRAELETFLSRLRVHSISDQDSTGPWIRQEFPSLSFQFRSFAYRGMYRGGDPELVDSNWVETHVRQGHGALGALYPNYRGGDIWANRLGQVRGVKEGDTPSFLYLLPGGPGDPDHPDWGSWGGRLVPTPGASHRWQDAVDPHPRMDRDPDPRMEGVYRWRPDFQRDFQARLDWCVKPVSEANHAPRFRRKSHRREVNSGQWVSLDAPECRDPDGDPLDWEWRFLPECGTTPATPTLPIERGGRRVRFLAPTVTRPETLHLLLTARDRGTPSLTAYTRWIITVRPRNSKGPSTAQPTEPREIATLEEVKVRIELESPVADTRDRSDVILKSVTAQSRTSVAVIGTVQPVYRILLSSNPPRWSGI